MRVNSVSPIRFGTQLDMHNVKRSPEIRRPEAPVIIHRAETPEQLDARDACKEAREAYNAVKNDKTVERAEKDRLKKIMDDAEKAYLSSLGLNA